MDKTKKIEIEEAVEKVLVKTKQWFESKTIILSLTLAALNVIVLAATYIKPVFESANSEAPRPVISLGTILILNIVFCLGIAYMRKISDSKIV